MSYANIIGRNKEIDILDRIYKSKKSEFVAIYGRRRVGKSYLVSEIFGKKIHKIIGETYYILSISYIIIHFAYNHSSNIMCKMNDYFLNIKQIRLLNEIF